jgi:hypothetical protein
MPFQFSNYQLPFASFTLFYPLYERSSSFSENIYVLYAVLMVVFSKVYILLARLKKLLTIL